jgi:chitodextrinase
VNVSWSQASDNVGVTGYTVFRDGVQVATRTTLSFADTGLSPSTSYSYTVDAVDAAGNHSKAKRLAFRVKR